ncbi:TonB-dependent receptor [Proteiniphilum sp.]|uniref:SusC/RagA family TonB-linked outer membrane protein n=1 Tax=Proteiniphilum sp. TaxID=1926877 RepID=UPI002B1FB467|nr:TonB-dependent receptor [Proteiniphilum sp.]
MKVKKTFNLLFIIIFMMIFSMLFAVGSNASESKELNILKENTKINETVIVRDVAQQQRVKISGRVVDQDGFSIPGATIAIKERPGVGTITDIEGKYSIECGANETLVYSFIGYTSKEEKAIEANNVTIVLEEDTIALDEVQVVAFGTQKKESVISSISAVRPEELRVPSSNITTAFAGRMSGVIAYQRSGEPGLDNAEFFIRGITTFSAGGKKDPLILIDGIEMTSTDLARLNVDDIASFSVMKDANAAALYGARGANGVILVSTKEGKADQISVNVRAELSSSANTDLVGLADPITYMRLHNEAVRTRDAMTELPYTSSKIRETELGTNPLMYPSVDWYNYMLKDRTFNQRINMNINGGGKAVQYYLAANYQHDTGILKESKENLFSNNININRIQVRSNVTIKLTPATTAIIRAYGSFDDQTGPRQGIVDGNTVSGGVYAFHLARNATPVRFLPYYPKDEANQFTNHILFGMGSELGSFTNPLAVITSRFREASSSMMLIQMEVNHRFSGRLDGLFAKGVFNVQRNASYSLERGYNPFYYHPATTLDGSYQLIALNPDTGTEYLDFTGGSSNVLSTIYGEFRLGYNKVFDDVHDLNALLVGTIRNETGLTNEAESLLYATLPRRNLSSAGRLAYGYDSRYFAEFNFGYNGTERFAKKNRFGFFPSAGVGWMISNEEFMEGIKNVISNLKLKATYGLVGNDQIGSKYDRFFYLSQISMNGVGYWFGNNRDYRTGITIGRYANDQITWEIAKKMNLGVEIGLFGDLTMLVDYFTETRENILQSRTDIPTTMGLRAVPMANVGIGKGKGFEVELKYQKNFNKDFWTVVNGNFTYATSRYKKLEEPDYSDAPWKLYAGYKINQPRGYIAERLFIDEEDVNNSPKQNLGGTYGAGDIKYKDINNDGVINADDIVPIGYPTVPEIIYGTGLSMGYKGFDLSCFFQGSARSSFMINSASITPFINNGQRGLLQYIADDHWSETNRNIYAFWPRLSAYQVPNNNVNSTHWLRNGAFIRLKTAEFGYTLPQDMTKKFHVSMFRIYVSGTNLLHWSAFKMWDPEMAGNGLGYPVQRVFNLGININF